MGQRSKAASLIGFCRRAGKLTLGLNGVAAVKRGVYLLVMEEDTSPNSQKEIKKLQTRFGCPLLVMQNLGGAAGKEGCKIAAVRDEGFARAMLAEAHEGRIDPQPS